MKCSFNFFITTFVLLSSINVELAVTQSINVNEFQYLSPKPNSSLVSPWINIIIRYGELINANTIKDPNLMTVTGTTSGIHNGDISLLDDGKTIIFKPNDSFSEGEKVSVKLRSGLKTINNDDIGKLEYQFYVSDSWQKNILNDNSNILFNEIKLMNPDLGNNDLTPTKINRNKVQPEIDSLELPNLYVTISNDPTEGYIFVSPWLFKGNFFDPNYIIISDNYGIPIYYKKISALGLDFKIHSNGVMTYHDRSTRWFYAMDSSYNVIDTFACGNGYTTDFHDLQILPDSKNGYHSGRW